MHYNSSSFQFPWYKNFTGTIEQTEPQKYNSIGAFQVIDDSKIEITELPIRTWTSNYKEGVLELYLHGTDKVKPIITYVSLSTLCCCLFEELIWVQNMLPQSAPKNYKRTNHSFFQLNHVIDMCTPRLQKILFLLPLGARRKEIS